MSDVVQPAAPAAGSPAPAPSAPATPPVDTAPGFRFEKPTPAPTSATPPAGSDAPAPKADEPKPEGQGDKPKADDKAAALKAAARASKEARDARKALEKVQAELTAAKTAGTNTTDAQATLDAIKKNPALLFEHGWDADKLLAKILSPDEPETPADPKVQALADEVKALKEAKEAETNAAKEAEDREAKARAETEDKAAHASIAKAIGAKSETYFLVDADDAPDIANAVVAYCEAENWAPTVEEAADLVNQAVRQLHEKREKRFGARLARKEGPKPVSSEGPGFREPRQQQHRPQAQPTPSTSITTSPGSLPIAAPKYVPSFR